MSDTENNTNETTKSDERDPYGFFQMDATNIRKVITDMTRESLELEEEKKDYVAGVNEIVKENKLRIKAALAALKQLGQKEADAAHERRTNEFLRSVPAAKQTAGN